MAASPWTLISLALCLVVSASVSSANVAPKDGAQAHSRVVRQIPADFQEKAQAAKKNFHEAASIGAQRAQDLASQAHSHLSERVRRSAGYRHGPAGERMGAWFDLWDGDLYGYGFYRDDGIERREDRRRDREERRREHREQHREETERHREDRERDREERELDREQRERERVREDRRRDRSII